MAAKKRKSHSRKKATPRQKKTGFGHWLVKMSSI